MTKTSFVFTVEHSQVWQVASQLEGHDTEVENWDIGAGLYIEFYTLKTSFVDSFGPVDELDSLEKKTAACKAFFEQLRRSQNFWKNKTSADARYSSFSSRVALDVDEVSELTECCCFTVIFNQHPLSLYVGCPFLQTSWKM
jgi:nuclear pore complex protein Nup98-Nup96